MLKNDDEIIIDDNKINEYNSKSSEIKEEKPNTNEIKEEKININENEKINLEKNVEKNQNVKEEYIINDNINEKNKIDSNNENNYIDNSNIIKNKNEINNTIKQLNSEEPEENLKDKNNNIKNEVLNDNNNNIPNEYVSSVIEKKEEYLEQNQNSNNQDNNNFNILNNNYGSQISRNQNNIIDNSQEYNSIENILNNNEKFKNQRNGNNPIFNNNNHKLYFTETNVLGNKLKKEFHGIESIPEYSNNLKYEAYNKPLTIEISEHPTKNVKHDLNYKLNNLSPKVYMKKKFVNKYNFQPLQYRLKKIEEEIEKQNKYDLQKVMKDMQIKYEKEKKNKEKEKHIYELHKNLEEKLKIMEEKRNILYNQKLEKVMKKQNRSNNKNKQKDNLNKSLENVQNNRISIDIGNYNSEKGTKLPLLQNIPRYEIVKLIKNKKEEEFCFNTIKKLKDNEITHRRNYLRQINIINKKIIKHKQLYKHRSEKCIIMNKNKEAKREENFLEKDMLRRYNINQILLRETSAKKEKIKENMIKNIESVKEKKELLEKEEYNKQKEIEKKLNKEIKKVFYENKERDYFSTLQKENFNKCNKEINNYYNEIIMKQEDNLSIINELQKDESIEKQDIIKRTLKEQNKRFKKLKFLENFLEKMDKNNINNQKEGTKRKIFLEKRRIELEKKRNEEEYY